MSYTPPPKTNFSGTRVLVALAVALLVGAAMAWCLYVIITHTPADVQDNRIRACLIIVICCGGLTGSVIETTRQLQASSTDPAITTIGGVGSVRQRTTTNASDADLFQSQAMA